MIFGVIFGLSGCQAAAAPPLLVIPPCERIAHRAPAPMRRRWPQRSFARPPSAGVEDGFGRGGRRAPAELLPGSRSRRGRRGLATRQRCRGTEFRLLFSPGAPRYPARASPAAQTAQAAQIALYSAAQALSNLACGRAGALHATLRMDLRAPCLRVVPRARCLARGVRAPDPDGALSSDGAPTHTDARRAAQRLLVPTHLS